MSRTSQPICERHCLPSCECQGRTKNASIVPCIVLSKSSSVMVIYQIPLFAVFCIRMRQKDHGLLLMNFSTCHLQEALIQMAGHEGDKQDAAKQAARIT